MNGVGMRRRGGLLFVVVVVAHIIMISAQVPSGARSSVPLLESVAFGVFSEVQRWVSGALARSQGIWRGYVDLRNVRVENDQLRRELADLQIQLQQQRALADRSSQLERLLGMRDRLPVKTTAAAVIGAGSTPDFRTMTIDKGTSDGLRPDMAVIAPRGIVGRIVVPSARAAKVQLLIDRNAAAGALVERSRAQGVVVGGGDAQRLRFDYVSAASDVQVGDLVVTSGIDGIFPKGFVIGSVQRLERGSSGLTEIEVRPAVDFSSLEEVLVVLTPPVGTEDGKKK
jgi:rod shape-determining protein MreC